VPADGICDRDEQDTEEPVPDRVVPSEILARQQPHRDHGDRADGLRRNVRDPHTDRHLKFLLVTQEVGDSGCPEGQKEAGRHEGDNDNIRHFIKRSNSVVEDASCILPIFIL
jgi:hypothetical protein